MKKNGFTLVELLGVIVLIAILGGLAVISVSHVIDSGKKGLYMNYESTLEGAARNVLSDYIGASSKKIEDNNLLKTIKPQWESKFVKLTYNDLLSNNYIEPLKDPNGGDCSYSYVEITRNNDNGSNLDLSYKTCLICKSGDNKYTYLDEQCNDSA